MRSYCLAASSRAVRVFNPNAAEAEEGVVLSEGGEPSSESNLDDMAH